MSWDAIRGWLAAGRLHRIHPGVYAVGHRRVSLEGRVHAALLLAGDGSVLSHTTAAWWWELIAVTPTRIHVSAPGYAGSVRDVCIHHPRELEVARHRNLLATPVARTLLDLAGMLRFDQLRLAVAEADHRGLLHAEEVASVLGRGRRGSAALRRAVVRHLPELARTRSPLEVDFLFLCEEYGVPIPEVNVWVEGLLVDAFWRDERVIVELDGAGTHGRPVAVREDRERELTLRSAGFTVVRYSRDQVVYRPVAVADDALRTLAQARQRNPPPAAIERAA